MKNYNLDFLAVTHLGIHGVSEKTLRQALSLYEKKSPKQNPRGRPDNVIGQLFVFWFYYKAIQKDGLTETQITNGDLAKSAEKIRNLTLLTHYTNKKMSDIPMELRLEVRETSVKGWRRRFREIRETDPERFHKIFNFIESKRQKTNTSFNVLVT
jgi:hypothetical protein